MTQRKAKGRNGLFWGCRNFKGYEGVTCKHTENEIMYDPELLNDEQE
jgi:hypothetical protein